MFSMRLILLAALCFAFVQVDCSPNGAPIAACSTMVPQHGAVAQDTLSPFATIITPVDDGSVKLTLTVNSQGYNHFKGYLTMAFDSSKPNSTDPIGYFTETNTKVAVTPGNYLNCPGANAQQKNAATHKDGSGKRIVNLVWKASPGFQGNVTFKTTFVYETSKFWVKTSTESIQVTGEDPITTIKPISTTPKPDGANSVIPSLSLLAFLLCITSLLHF